MTIRSGAHTFTSQLMLAAVDGARACICMYVMGVGYFFLLPYWIWPRSDAAAVCGALPGPATPPGPIAFVAANRRQPRACPSFRH